MGGEAASIIFASHPELCLWAVPQPPCRALVWGRGAGGQPSLRAVESFSQARLLEIWVTLSKNRLLPWAMAPAPLHCASWLVQRPQCKEGSGTLGSTSCVLENSGGKAARSRCSLLQLQLESEVSLGADSDRCSPLLCNSLGESLWLLGFSSG